MLTWAKSRAPLLRLGYAGTGKSTLVGLLARELGAAGEVGFCAFTGKATSVLRRKLADAGVQVGPEACNTIHGLMYEPEVDRDTGRVLRWKRRPSLGVRLLVVDEASMLGAELLAELRGYGVKLLLIGDHGQLPPVGEERGPMANPDVELREIHRQAAGNPIIGLSAEIRASGRIPVGASPPGILRIAQEDLGAFVRDAFPEPARTDETVVLCRVNRARVELNALVRACVGLGGAPLVSQDRIVCLRNTTVGGWRIANGWRGVVETAAPDGDHFLRCTIRLDDEGLRVKDARVPLAQLGCEHTFDAFSDLPGNLRSWDEAGILVDHGYALTVHKAQGSQWRRVVVCVPPEPDKTWLYTAVTRAEEELVLVETPRLVARRA